jgi:peptidyl-tRNA hydrolase, PTH2 family
MNLKQVIVLRKDLGMNKGKMIAQGAHASMAFILDMYFTVFEWPEETIDWAVDGQAKIVVGVDSLEELNEIIAKAKEAGLPVYGIIDSGKTVAACQDQKTCAAIGPADAAAIDAITGHLKLL